MHISWRLINSRRSYSNINIGGGSKVKAFEVELSDVNIKLALAKWLQKHSFDAEHTIRQLPTDDQYAKDGVCGGESGNVIFFVWITIRPFSAAVDIRTYDSFREVPTHITTFLPGVQVLITTSLSFPPHVTTICSLAYHLCLPHWLFGPDLRNHLCSHQPSRVLPVESFWKMRHCPVIHCNHVEFSSCSWKRSRRVTLRRPLGSVTDSNSWLHVYKCQPKRSSSSTPSTPASGPRLSKWCVLNPAVQHQVHWLQAQGYPSGA